MASILEISIINVIGLQIFFLKQKYLQIDCIIQEAWYYIMPVNEDEIINVDLLTDEWWAKINNWLLVVELQFPKG